MKYEKIRPGTFLDRPNRFVAHVELGGTAAVCHVKNTGRCRELLVPGAKVYLEESGNPARKTQYDLIAVEKGTRLINMDSQAPNRVFEEWARGGGFLPELSLLRPETTYRNSRFDFYWESSAERGICGGERGHIGRRTGWSASPMPPRCGG
jgi:DNA-binding protein, stimulates sugar fermentation